MKIYILVWIWFIVFVKFDFSTSICSYFSLFLIFHNFSVHRYIKFHIFDRWIKCANISGSHLFLLRYEFCASDYESCEIIMTSWLGWAGRWWELLYIFKFASSFVVKLLVLASVTTTFQTLAASLKVSSQAQKLPTSHRLYFEKKS